MVITTIGVAAVVVLFIPHRAVMVVMAALGVAAVEETAAQAVLD
jgi:hypothetical protein